MDLFYIFHSPLPLLPLPFYVALGLVLLFVFLLPLGPRPFSLSLGSEEKANGLRTLGTLECSLCL